MQTPTLRVLVGVVLGFLLIVGGFGSMSLAHQVAQDCHERWDDGPDAHADCEDGLHALMTWGGTLFGVFGLALLGAAAREHYGRDDAESSGEPS